MPIDDEASGVNGFGIGIAPPEERIYVALTREELCDYGLLGFFHGAPFFSGEYGERKQCDESSAKRFHGDVLRGITVIHQTHRSVLLRFSWLAVIR